MRFGGDVVAGTRDLGIMDTQGRSNSLARFALCGVKIRLNHQLADSLFFLQ
jgi:hypothetical protein